MPFHHRGSSQDTGHGSNNSASRRSQSRSRSRFPDFPASFQNTAPIAARAIAEDIEHEHDHDPESANAIDDESEISVPAPDYSKHSMAQGWHRPSFVASGGPRGFVPASLPDYSHLAQQRYLPESEQQLVHEDERSLLRDANLIPPKHPKRPRQSSIASTITDRMRTKLTQAGLRRPYDDDEDAVDDDYDDRTSLLGVGDPSKPYGGVDTSENIAKAWDEAVEAGKIHTTWQREAKTLAKYSRSLILTFVLQYSLTVTSVFAVGHIGKIELGAVSLATMTANITGYAFHQGLATALDTLCSQAYGCGHKKLVGLQFQRMLYFLWLVTIPIAVIWASSPAILGAFVPEKEVAALAAKYLQIAIIGTPGYAAFECGKRFMQAQGLFSANLAILVFCAPLNAVLHWLFVWKLEWGFVGAPIAVVITQNLMAVLLLCYVLFINGYECWGGFERRAFSNWLPMVKLALSGLSMVYAEFLAFEILTLSASWISATHLAAQSVITTVSCLVFQLPFPISIAISTRIANLIGATLADSAKTAAKVSLISAAIVGCFNLIILGSLRFEIPKLFTDDPEVSDLVSKVLPINASFQLVDALATNCNGILRGLGKQEVGGYINIIAYYVIAMPVSFGTGFGLGWGLYGLWFGPALALTFVFFAEGWYIFKTSWEDSVEEAQLRNTAS